MKVITKQIKKSYLSKKMKNNVKFESQVAYCLQNLEFHRIKNNLENTDNHLVIPMVVKTLLQRLKKKWVVIWRIEEIKINSLLKILKWQKQIRKDLDNVVVMVELLKSTVKFRIQI